MLKAIRMIIAQKCVENRRPLLATSMEVYRSAGIPIAEQLNVARILEAESKIVVGKAFNDVYYRLVEV